MYKIDLESIGDVKKYVWHYRKDDVEHGPFTYEDIVEMVKKGEIGPEDYLLKFGNRKFFKASEVEGLFDRIEQSEGGQEEQEVLQEDQIAESEEQPEGNVVNMVFENSKAPTQAKHSTEAPVGRIIMAAAGLLGLCLAIWVLTRLF